MESLRNLNERAGAAPPATRDSGMLSPAERQILGERSEVLFDDGPPLLRVHLISEDVSTGTRGTRLVQALAEHLQFEADFKVTSTPFEILGTMNAEEIGIEEAGDADILLLSAHGKSELPPALVVWVHNWIKERTDGPRALIISLDAEAEGTVWAGQIEATLQQNAQTASVDVFSHYDRLVARAEDFSLENIQYRAQTRTALLDETLRSEKPSSHWGINE
jgi:hypothetical protein